MNKLENAGWAASAACDARQTSAQEVTLNFPRSHSGVRDRHPPDFRVILGRYDHFKCGRQCTVAPDEFSAIFVKGGLVRFGFDAARLKTSGPDFICLRIAKKDIAAPRIEREILAPSGNGNVSPRLYPEPAAVSITAYLPLESRCVRGTGPWGVLNLRTTGGMSSRTWAAAVTLFCPRPRNEHVARGAFLQEQFGSLHHGLGMKTAAHRAAVRQVRDGDKQHSLMVCKVGARK